MPQEMNVLCCYACNMYQGQLVKKSNKWQCKICGEKQSIQVVYFQGSGMDCRIQVQRLNFVKASKPEKRSFSSPTIDAYGLDCDSDESEKSDIDSCQYPKRLKQSNGKWSRYLESSSSSSSGSDENIDHDIPNDKENVDYHKNSELFHNLQKLRCSTESYSFPGNRSYDFQNVTLETRAGGSKSRTHPLSERSRKVYDKYEKYLNNTEEEQDSKLKTNRSSAMTFSSDKKLPGKWEKFLEIPKDKQSFVEQQSEKNIAYVFPNSDIRNSSSSSGYQASSSDIQACDYNTQNYSLTERSSKFYKKQEENLDNKKETPDSSSKNNFSVNAMASSEKKLSGKWDKFLKNQTNGKENFEIDETPNNNLTANNRQSAKNNIFDDCNDDLDLTVDF